MDCCNLRQWLLGYTVLMRLMVTVFKELKTSQLLFLMKSELIVNYKRII